MDKKIRGRIVKREKAEHGRERITFETGRGQITLDLPAEKLDQPAQPAGPLTVLSAVASP